MLGKSLELCFSRLKWTTCSTSTTQELPNPPVKKPASTDSTTVFKSFNSLYEDPSPSSSSISTGTLTLASTTSVDDGGDEGSSPELAAAIASRRLAPAAPGRSRSIVDAAAAAGGAGVAVGACSPDPRGEFRRSMEEMAASMGLTDPSKHRARLQDLLLCYLALNRRTAHKDIVGAFEDLLQRLSNGGGVRA